jgi:dihydroxyacetone kinase-like protein
MRSAFGASTGGDIVQDLIGAIDREAAHLSALDGAIGDGDHGVNMRKGFLLAGERLKPGATLAEALETLGSTLLDEIGGAMGPLYGSMFLAMGAAAQGPATIDAARFDAMLDAGVNVVLEIGGARPGDKTLVDVLVPARAAFAESIAAGEPFDVALRAMATAAESGRDATRDLVARIGRASRLGDRSIGAIDAGAASAALILSTLASSIGRLLDEPGPAGRP